MRAKRGSLEPNWPRLDESDYESGYESGYESTTSPATTRRVRLRLDESGSFAYLTLSGYLQPGLVYGGLWGGDGGAIIRA